MTHYYEKNIVEIKNEYTEFLTNILTPLIYEGIKRIYDKSVETHNKFVNIKKLKNKKVDIPNILKIFQIFLKGIKDINNHNIEIETERIREKCKCSEWFDDLIKAVIKSYIILLTYNATEKTCNIVEEKHYLNIKTKNFIHKCYIECSRIFYNYPELFWHKYVTLQIKKNQREAYDLIKLSIIEAIRKMLPMKLILEEYLSNDYICDNSETTEGKQYNKIKNLVINNESSNTNKIIESDNEDSEENDIVQARIPSPDINIANIAVPIEQQVNEQPNNQVNEQPNEQVNEQPNEQINEQPNEQVNEQPNEQVNEQPNEQPNVFAKKGGDLLVSEQVNRLNQPGYIKSPPAIRLNKKNALNELINFDNDKNKINIDFIKQNIKSE
jgi:hypothetical protein